PSAVAVQTDLLNRVTVAGEPEGLPLGGLVAIEAASRDPAAIDVLAFLDHGQAHTLRGVRGRFEVNAHTAAHDYVVVRTQLQKQAGHAVRRSHGGRTRGRAATLVETGLDGVIAQPHLGPRGLLIHQHRRHFPKPLPFQDQRSYLRQNLVALSEFPVRGCEPVDPKRRVADAVIPAGRGDGVRDTTRVSPGFGDEQRVARLRVPGAPFGVVWNVDVRRQNVDRGPSGPPGIQHLWQRPAARIAAGYVFAGLVLSLAQPGVHEHRQRIFGFTGRRDVAHVAAVVPRHEQFVGFHTGAEDRFPASGGLEAGGFPTLAEFGNERVLVLLQVV